MKCACLSGPAGALHHGPHLPAQLILSTHSFERIRLPPIMYLQSLVHASQVLQGLSIMDPLYQLFLLAKAVAAAIAAPEVLLPPRPPNGNAGLLCYFLAVGTSFLACAAAGVLARSLVEERGYSSGGDEELGEAGVPLLGSGAGSKDASMHGSSAAGGSKAAGKGQEAANEQKKVCSSCRANATEGLVSVLLLVYGRWWRSEGIAPMGMRSWGRQLCCCWAIGQAASKRACMAALLHGAARLEQRGRRAQMSRKKYMQIAT